MKVDSDNVKSSIQGDKWVSIDVSVERKADDYHDLVLALLQDLTFRLAGGYYEPKSDRDAELAEKLDYFIRDYKSGLIL